MPNYSSYTSGLYSAITTGQYYQLDADTAPEHTTLWNDIRSVDPLTDRLLDLNPVFFDALYEPRMAEKQYYMNFYSSSAHKLENHYGRGVMFGEGSGNPTGIKYTSYLEDPTTLAGDLSVVFAMCTRGNGLSHNFLGTATPRVAFKAAIPNTSNIQVETYRTGATTTGDLYDATALSYSPVAYWPLNDDGVWADATGNGHTLTEVGTVTNASLSNGMTGANLNGSSYLTTPDVYDLRPENWSTGWSLSVWIQRPDAAAISSIFTKNVYTASPAAGIGFGVWDNDAPFMSFSTWQRDSRFQRNVSPLLGVDTAEHWVFTIDWANQGTSAAKIYRNGVDIGGLTQYSSNGSVPWTWNANTIGAEVLIGAIKNYPGGGVSQYFTGKFAKIALYDYKLSSSDVTALYNGTPAPLETDPAAMRLSLSDPSGIAIAGEDNINDLKPHIVVLTRDNIDSLQSTYSLYVDGALQGTKTVSSTSTITEFEGFGIGQWPAESGWPADVAWGSPPAGQLSMSHLAIFNYALSPSVISGLTAATLPPPGGGGWFVFYNGQWRRFLI